MKQDIRVVEVLEMIEDDGVKAGIASTFCAKLWEQYSFQGRKHKCPELYKRCQYWTSPRPALQRSQACPEMMRQLECTLQEVYNLIAESDECNCV